ncbi:MAG: nucleoside phosphorylase [Nitrososphaeria archaeon]
MKHVKKDLQIHTAVGRGDVAPYVLLAGDPGRISQIASFLEKAQKIVENREFTTYGGFVQGTPVTACSTGIGSPSTAIVVEELSRLGAHTFIRIGTSGGLGEGVNAGDLVISTGSIRSDGASRTYAWPEYPAVAHYEVVSALVEGARRLRQEAHVGITWCVDGFYSENKMLSKGKLMPMSFRGFQLKERAERLLDVKAMGAKNVEMETGTLLTLANIFGLRAGAVCLVSDVTPWRGPLLEGYDPRTRMKDCIAVAVEAVKILSQKEGSKG